LFFPLYNKPLKQASELFVVVDRFNRLVVNLTVFEINLPFLLPL